MYFNPYHIFLNDTFVWCHLFRDNIRKYKRIVKKKKCTYGYREKNLEKYTLYFFSEDNFYYWTQKRKTSKQYVISLQLFVGKSATLFWRGVSGGSGWIKPENCQKRAQGSAEAEATQSYELPLVDAGNRTHIL